MKYYVEFPCDNIDIISRKIYNFLETKTDIIEICQSGWHFIDCKDLLNHVPELFDFFKSNKLLPRHAAITIVIDNNSLPMHVDELPVVAKLNLPVINTQGWANCWYINNELVAELLDLPQPIIFNSQIAHSVEQRSADALAPRIIASFTFHNEPLELLR
jgi:hypothetical protein